MGKLWRQPNVVSGAVSVKDLDECYRQLNSKDKSSEEKKTIIVHHLKCMLDIITMIYDRALKSADERDKFDNELERYIHKYVHTIFGQTWKYGYISSQYFYNFFQKMYALSSITDTYLDLYIHCINLYTTESGSESGMLQINRLIRIQHAYCSYREKELTTIFKITDILDKVYPLREIMPSEIKNTLKSKLTHLECHICKVEFGNQTSEEHCNSINHSIKLNDFLLVQINNQLLAQPGFNYCIICRKVAMDVVQHLVSEEHSNLQDSYCLVCQVSEKPSTLVKIHFFGNCHHWKNRHFTYLAFNKLDSLIQSSTWLTATNDLQRPQRDFINAEQIKKSVCSLKNADIGDLNIKLEEKLKTFVNVFFESNKSQSEKQKILLDLAVDQLTLEEVYHLIIDDCIYKDNMPEVRMPKSKVKYNQLIISTRKESYDKAMKAIEGLIEENLAFNSDDLKAVVTNVFESEHIPFNLLPKCLESFNDITKNY